jgi:hypothetical protein
MEMSWRTCPRCTGRSPDRAITGRDATDLTMVDGAPVATARAPEPAHRGVAVLVVESGPAAGGELEILPGRWRVGRAPHAEAGEQPLAIADPGMSRNHFVLEAGVAAVVLRDLGSTNGTLVNGGRVERHVLAEGDVVRAGGTTIRVRLFLKR